MFTLHYILFDGNAKTMLILSDGYWSEVTSEKLCDQTAIRIKGILRSAELVNYCIPYVQLLVDGEVSTQDWSMV